MIYLHVQLHVPMCCVGVLKYELKMCFEILQQHGPTARDWSKIKLCGYEAP